MPTPLSPASAQDATHIRNGVYAIGDGHSTFTFKIHTLTQARNADLVGKRIVSRMTGNGGYQAFAFLAVNGKLKLWQRFADETREPYMRFAEALMRILPNAIVDAYEARNGMFRHYDRDLGQGDDQLIYTVEFSLLCRVCNGGLRQDDDMVSGIHFNGSCTTELSPRQQRDENARIEREAEHERVMAQQATQLAEVASLRGSGSGTFPDVPDAMVARLSRSEITPGLIR